MSTPARVIPVPKPSGTAYNPNRPLSKNTLIQAQLKHFADVEKHLPVELQTGIDVRTIQTEGEASAYIRQVTRAIHQNAGRTAKVRKAT